MSAPLFRTAAVVLLASASLATAPQETGQSGDSALPALAPARPFEPIVMGDGASETYEHDFYEGDSHAASVTSPDELLGQPVGSRVASHAEIVGAFRTWASESSRLRLGEYGRTYEDRPLIYGVISSDRHITDLDRIQRGIARLADPRGLSEADAQKLIAKLPAIAWLGYSIHGDETSGSDAALAVAYHLIASESSAIERMLRNVVVVLDPCLNPDGRSRFLAQLTAGQAFVRSLDYASMHRGRWPYGRTNHYLFDMNRDWMVGSAPETRGRWSVLGTWHPQLFVDAHEMSGLDTFLFYPQADPENPHLWSELFNWQARFASDCAQVFDRFGWGYYTREWADAWYPSYSDAWGSLNGAVGMLYEQGRVGGQPLKRASGEVVTYREAVHGQFVASLSNLRTLAKNREEMLNAYVKSRRSNVNPNRPNAARAFIFKAGARPERESRFLEILLDQGIEVWRTDEEITVSSVEHSLGERSDTSLLPGGSWVVPSLQPQSPLVHAYLDFDPRIDREMLLKERRSLEKDNSSKIYDITAWDLGRAHDLDASWCDLPASRSGMTRVLEVPKLVTGAQAGHHSPHPYALCVDGSLDSSVRFAAAALDAGLAVHLSDKEFRAAGRLYPPGSLIVRRHENAEDETRAWEFRVRAIAEATRTPVFSTYTGRSPDDGPDLGGGHFHLLERPRIALLSNSPVSATDYGHIWQLVDEELRLPASVLDAQSFGRYDLRRFNVLVVPPARGLAGTLGKHAEALRDWVRAGGTLIAVGSSAGAFTSGDLDLGSVVRRRDALDKLDIYAAALTRARAAGEPQVDEADLWGDVVSVEDAQATEDEAQAGDSSAEETADEEDAKTADEDGEVADKGEGADERRDAWARRFSPAGVILRAEVDVEHWLAAGCNEEMPVFWSGGTVLLARSPVQTPLRLASEEKLRLGGLLWPEARERIADSAWVTVEGQGHGQVILFAAPPGFRGAFRGGARVLANAIVYGPGAGADAPLDW